MFKDYINTSIDCECGRVHEVPIKNIIIEKNSLQKVPQLLKDLTEQKKIYIIGDNNTFAAAGNKLSTLLKQADFNVEEVCLEAENLIPDPQAVYKILEKVNPDGYLLACGSGTINDLTRFVSYKMGKPYSVVGTAPSMDGYASSVSSITVDGVKKTYRVAPAEAIVTDLEVLKNAPWELIQAGFGDLLGKMTSLLDWKLAKILFDEYYCERIVKLVKKEVHNLMKIGPKLKNRNLEDIETLITGLINSGLGILMIGKSRPASGCEHHISHFLAMYGLMNNIKLPYHGIKVGLGTYFSSSFYLKLKEIDFSQMEISDSREKRIENIENIYKSRSKLALNNLQNRWGKEKIDKKLLKDKENEIKNMINDSSQDLKQVLNHLEEMKIFQHKDINKIEKNWLEKALKYSFEIRFRYTIATLLHQTGYLNQWSEELIQEFIKKGYLK